ncbi:hypothetical protein [Motilibacter aurantiacus]|uniref:hypothetical protein n=1 Tax=Motilibacter aurantiacus TaxID=2714955 RepID=UPI00140C3C5E|nr:hypothetical protein [Motilibacter aurantiacus]NHC46296.1 hypothetical protein [Motilibacter aurantiacus]
MSPQARPAYAAAANGSRPRGARRTTMLLPLMHAHPVGRPVWPATALPSLLPADAGGHAQHRVHLCRYAVPGGTTSGRARPAVPLRV